MEKIKILIADFDQDSLAHCSSVIADCGYETATASNGIEAWNRAVLFRPHLILMDLMNSEKTGVNVCQQLRLNRLFNNTIIIIFTMYNDEAILNEKLNGIVDGFIKKPVNSEILCKYISNKLQRMNVAPQSRKMIEINSISIDIEGYTVKKENKIINLAKREFELLIFLASDPERTFSRKEIIEYMWNGHHVDNDRVLDVYIAKLRNKIGKQFIHTMKGVGYSFVS